MSDDEKPKRFHIVKHTFTVIHDNELQEDSADFFYTEHHCSGNTVNDLAAGVAVDQEYSVCNICRWHKAEYVGSYDKLEDAEAVGGYDMDPKRKRAKLKEHFNE